MAEEKAKPGSETTGGLEGGLVEEIALDCVHPLGELLLLFLESGGVFEKVVDAILLAQ